MTVHRVSRRAVGLALVSLVAGRSLNAQAIEPAEYTARRDSLAARLGSGVLVAFGAPSPTGVARQSQ